MSSSSVEVSFDTSQLLNSHALDGSDFLDPEFSPSPTKRDATPLKFNPCLILSVESTPDLACQRLFSSELFLVTQHLREGKTVDITSNASPLKSRRSARADVSDTSDERLRNNKIEKLLYQLSDDTEGDYEMDSEVRSGVVTNRFQRKPYDAFDLHLDNFLQNPNGRKNSKSPPSSLFFHENKENLSSLVKPSKRKLIDSRTNISFRKRRSTPPLPSSSAANGILPASMVSGITIPPIHNLASKQVPETSPHRICVPRSVNLPKQPAIKFRKNCSIFLVDSLTGSVSDATQFGTELNSSNCEGFPLPDDINEVVQIPTNATGPGTSPAKMAIIKAVYSRRLWKKEQKSEKVGFYSKREFEEVKLKAGLQMTIFNDTKKVRWADDLEW